jgi:hypothetical protein
MNGPLRISSCWPLVVFSTVLGLMTAAILFPGSYSQLRAQANEQTAVLPKDKTVVDMTANELLQYYSAELRHLQFSPNQEELSALLPKVGERVQAFFRDFSNTSSKEYVLLQRLDYNGRPELSSNHEFRYLIVYHPGEAGPLLEEYRTDGKNRPVGQDAIRGFLMTSGYACISLNFHPGYHQASRFRYLGRQASDARAHVIAFAQKIETAGLQIEYTDSSSGKSSRLPVQGLAWIAPDTYQILRLRIDLLPAGNRSALSQQTTDIRFSEVRFDNVRKQLWLPREVVVTTKIGGRSFRNLHQYSEYKLFAVESDYKIDKPKSRN